MESDFMEDDDMEYKIVYLGQKPTPKQIEEIRKLKDRLIVFDEDCPELTEEELKQFKRVYPRRKEKAVG